LLLDIFNSSADETRTIGHIPECNSSTAIPGVSYVPDLWYLMFLSTFASVLQITDVFSLYLLFVTSFFSSLAPSPHLHLNEAAVKVLGFGGFKVT
jgi:hypothetical protein